MEAPDICRSCGEDAHGGSCVPSQCPQCGAGSYNPWDGICSSCDQYVECVDCKVLFPLIHGFNFLPFWGPSDNWEPPEHDEIWCPICDEEWIQ